MKNLFRLSILAIVFIVTSTTYAQNAKKIKMTQVDGAFVKKELKLKAGQAYVFEVENKNVEHEVGFVIAPEGMTDQEHHIKNAYLQKTISKGEKSSSKEVVLEKGEYVYFCPMNPTPQYKITVN